MFLRSLPVCLAFGASGLSLLSCMQTHRAEVLSPELPPLAQPVLHSNRLWVDIRDSTGNAQCVRPQGSRELCFDGVRDSLAEAFRRTLWTTFPAVEIKSRGDEPARGDYVLVVEAKLAALPPGADAPGWSAEMRGEWQLLRDGQWLMGESVSSRSRPEFAYGRPLGVGAGEALNAVAVRVATALGSVPERRIVAPVPLPPVVATPLEAPSSESSATQSAAPGTETRERG